MSSFDSSISYIESYFFSSLILKREIQFYGLMSPFRACAQINPMETKTQNTIDLYYVY
jgi:hypothetical protein